jgi:hypothetical protein
MIQNRYIVALTALILLIVFCLFWFKAPNEDEKAVHVATLCNVIKNNPDLSTKDEIFQQVKFSYGNSTPSYAYKKPKFYERYTHHVIQNYLSSSLEDQKNYKNDYVLCFKNLHQ